MNKQELLHLHSLAREIAAFCEADTAVTLDLESYLAMGTNPFSIQQSKTRHETAVSELLDKIVEGLDLEADGPRLPQAAD